LIRDVPKRRVLEGLSHIGGTVRSIIARTSGAAVLFVVLSATLAIGAAVAQEQDIVRIPLDTVMYGKPGAVKLIDPPGVVNVPAAKVGSKCSVHETSENNRSTHPNTDLIVTSGGASVTLLDVEQEGGGRVDGDSLLTLGETVKVEVRFGADGVFSGGFLVGLCETEVPPPPPCANPTLSIDVAPGDQEVVIGGDASFDVTVTNTGDERFSSVDVGSSIAACDSALGAMALGEQSSYTCTAEGVGADLDVTFHAAGQGQDRSCVASADAGAGVTVQEPPPPPPPPPQQPPPPTGLPTQVAVTPPAPRLPAPRLPSVRVTTTTTAAIPSGVPTGNGDDATDRMPVAAVAVIGFGIAAIAAGTYRVGRREE
jgi:hypothetical protein